MDFDPTDLDGWTDVDSDVCPEVLSIMAGDVLMLVRCEEEGAHEEHEATVRWKTEPPG